MSLQSQNLLSDDAIFRHDLRKVFPDNPKVQEFIFSSSKKNASLFLIRKTIFRSQFASVTLPMKIYYLHLMKELACKSRAKQGDFMKYNSSMLTLNALDNESQKYVPTTLSEARALCEGQNSFLSFLPVPKISRKPKFSHVESIKEVLSISIALGLQFERVSPSNQLKLNGGIHHRSILNSNKVKELIKDLKHTDRTDYVVNVSFWCDKYNSGLSVRNSLKMFSISIVNKPNMTRKHTFPLALIPGKNDQKKYIEYFFIQLKELKENDIICYDPTLNRIVRVRFNPTHSNTDRPEWEELVGFIGTRGICGGIAEYCCPTNPSAYFKLIKQFHACQNCISLRSTAYHDGNFNLAYKNVLVCPSCYDWNHTAVKFVVSNFPDPIDINDEILNHYDGAFLSSRRITFDSMYDACNLIYKRVAKGVWTIEKAKVYGRYECLNVANVIDPVISEAKRFRDRNRRRQREGQERLQPTDVPEDKLPPAIRYREILPLSHYHVGLMHTVALRGGNNMVYLLTEALKKVSSETEKICQIATDREIFVEVRRLSLNWLKVWTQPFSNWWSENYLGFAFIAKSYISKVASICEDTGGVRGVETAKILTACFFAWNAMVSTIFMDGNPSDEDVNRLGALVKIFLSYYNLIDDVTSTVSEKDEVTEDERTKIERCSSLKTLLALPEKMKTFGNLRNFWEGGYDGEGFIRLVKPLLKRGIHQSGNLKSVLQKYYRLSSLDDLLEEEERLHSQDNIESVDGSEEIDYESGNGHDEEEEDIRTFLNTERYRRFHCYASIFLAYENIDRKFPAAVMIHNKSKRWYILHYNDKKRRMLKAIKAETLKKINYTLCFDVDKMEDEHAVFIEDVSVLNADYTSAIILPMFTYDNENGGESVSYYMTTEDHKEYSIGNRFVYPKCI